MGKAYRQNSRSFLKSWFVINFNLIEKTDKKIALKIIKKIYCELTIKKLVLVSKLIIIVVNKYI